MLTWMLGCAKQGLGRSEAPPRIPLVNFSFCRCFRFARVVDSPRCASDPKYYVAGRGGLRKSQIRGEFASGLGLFVGFSGVLQTSSPFVSGCYMTMPFEHIWRPPEITVTILDT